MNRSEDARMRALKQWVRSTPDPPRARMSRERAVEIGVMVVIVLVIGYLAVVSPLLARGDQPIPCDDPAICGPPNQRDFP